MTEIKPIRYSYSLARYDGRDEPWSVFLYLEGQGFEEVRCETEKAAFDMGEKFCAAIEAANRVLGHTDDRSAWVMTSGSLTDPDVPTRSVPLEEYANQMEQGAKESRSGS